PARGGDPAGARAEAERVALVETRLERALEHRIFVLDLDHVDRAVRAGLRARGAARTRTLVDHDLFLLGVELDRVVRARVDAALIGTRAARVDEVEHAELVAAERQPARAVALLACLLAQLAVDAQVELADADHLARHADALAHEEVEQLLLDARHPREPLARHRQRTPEPR